MSASSSPPPSTGAAGKQRSSTERIIVWGGILVLLALVGIEYTARAGFDNALQELNSKMQAIDNDKSGNAAVTESDVKAAMGGKNPESTQDLANKRIANTARRLDTYRWFSLNPFTERKLFIYYGYGHAKNTSENPEVLEVTTELVPTSEEKFPQLSPDDLEVTAAVGALERLGAPLPTQEEIDATTKEVRDRQAARDKAKAEGKSAEEVTRLVEELKAQQAASKRKNSGKKAAKQAPDEADKTEEK